MKTIEQIEQEIRDWYLQDLQNELESVEDWLEDARKRYNDDVKFFWKSWCDSWEVDAANDVVSKVKTQIITVNNVLSYFWENNEKK